MLCPFPVRPNGAGKSQIGGEKHSILFDRQCEIQTIVNRVRDFIGKHKGLFDVRA